MALRPLQPLRGQTTGLRRMSSAQATTPAPSAQPNYLGSQPVGVDPLTMGQKSRRGKGTFGVTQDFDTALDAAMTDTQLVTQPIDIPGAVQAPQTTQEDYNWMDTSSDWTSQYGDLYSAPYADPDQYYYPQNDPLGQQFGWEYDEQFQYWTGSQRQQYDQATQRILKIMDAIARQYGEENATDLYGTDLWQNDEGPVSGIDGLQVVVDGQAMSLKDARSSIEQLKSERKGLYDDWQAQFGDEDRYYETFDWLTTNFSTLWDDVSVVSPFQSEWDNIFADSFADLAGFGSSTEFLAEFMDQFQIEEIATGSVNPEDYGYTQWSPEFVKHLLDNGIDIPGFDFDFNDPNVTAEQQFIGYLMQTAQGILNDLQESEIDFGEGVLGEAHSQRVQAALTLFGNPGYSREEIEAIVKGHMGPIRAEAELQKKKNRLDKGLQLMGDSGAAARLDRLTDQDVRLTEAAFRGDLIEKDGILRQQNMQAGLQALGGIEDTVINAMIDAMGISATREANALNFLSSVGNVAVGSKGTEYGYYTDRLQLAQGHWKDQATLNLTKELELAGLDIQMFDITTDAGIADMQIRVEAALRNRGMDIDEAKANAANMIAQYQLGLSFAEMDIARLATLAELAAKGQQGDRDAWGLYQGMILEENLKNRGFDIQQSGMLADLAFGMWQTDKQTALTMWVEKYRGELQKELAQMEIDNQPSEWLMAAGSFFGGVGNLIGFMGGGGDDTQPPKEVH